jgi:HEPN domain-containing protein/predicted nucleotidyltransferase
VVARKARGRGTTKPVSTGKAVLDAAVRRLVEALHPERIYLFGSRARGDTHQDSDYDFLVVVPDESAAQRRALEGLAREALSGLAASKDVLVYTVGQFERNRPVVASMSATVEREGRLLYGPPPAPMEVLNPMEAAERRAALARTWLARASEDLEMARLATRAERPLLASAVYHCQQAFEKALKGFLAWHDQPLRKTHELQELVGLCAEIDPDFERLLEPAGVVSPYAFKFRYPSVDSEGVLLLEPSEPSRGETERGLALAEEAVQFVLGRLPQVSHPGS